MGGSQVYLRENESFPVDDMLYALMVQSANDAAVALATGLAGSPQAFVERMNSRAAALGMERTQFHSVHGLPPSAGQKPDVSTARDLARLGCALVARPDALRYTSTVERGFRDGQFIMRNHNPLLGQGGCDGLKTGYFRAAGYTIMATAEREGRRVVAVVAGCSSRDTRNSTAARLLTEGLAKAQPRGAVVTPSAPATRRAAAAKVPPAIADMEAGDEEAAEEEGPAEPGRRSRFWPRAGLIGLGVIIGFLLSGIVNRRRLP
jgi:D-alanyl-D-alanine carboxypeptidase (penicillin-binding protein 5/6)